MVEDQSPEVTFKYFLPEHSDEVYLHTNSMQMYCLLHEIDQKCRSILKYEDNASPDKQKLAEEIREMIHNEINMDRIR